MLPSQSWNANARLHLVSSLAARVIGVAVAMLLSFSTRSCFVEHIAVEVSSLRLVMIAFETS
jgi:hypothetical protein